jgi:hypothetical protein
MDAERYKMHYDTMVGAHAQFSPSRAKEEAGNVCMLWQKLLDAYIRPNSPKEVNLPAAVRDRLLSLSYKPSVPDPAELDSASKIIYDLMDESVLVPFLNSVTVTRALASPSLWGSDEPVTGSRMAASLDATALSPSWFRLIRGIIFNPKVLVEEIRVALRMR